MPSLKQLRYFDAVARFGHFGRAAEHCLVTQPALSMQIRELERDLGVQLFERRPTGVALTEPGRELAERAARILTEVRDFCDFAAHSQETLAGRFALGVIPSIAPYLLPPLLPLLQRGFPGLELAIRETQTRTLVDLLSEGTLDLLLLALPLEQGEIETMPLFEDRFLLAAPPGTLGDKRLRATPNQIENDRLLLLEEGHCLRDQALAFCELRQVTNINTFGASSLSTIVQMVANGMGMTLLPEMSLELELRHQSLDLLRFAEPEPRRSIGLAWRKSSPRRHDFEAFGNLVRAAAGHAAEDEEPSAVDAPGLLVAR